MLNRLLRWFFLDKQARTALDQAKRPPAVRPARRPPPPAQATTAPERTSQQALADAAERMKRLPPEKAQLIRSALLIQKATRSSALSDLSEEEVAKLKDVANRTFGGGGGGGG